MTDYTNVDDDLPMRYAEVIFKDNSGSIFYGVYDDRYPTDESRFAKFVSNDGNTVTVPNVTMWKYTKMSVESLSD